MTLTMTGLITDTRLVGGDNHHAGKRPRRRPTARSA
jgi:hypothetical protein